MGILAELLNTKVNYILVRDDEDTYTEKAMINGRMILFTAEYAWIKSIDEPSWEVAFMERANKHDNFTTRITGSGGELQVFSFVRDALARYLKSHDPDAFHFSASDSEPSRIKLYGSLASRFKNSKYTASVLDYAGSRYWCYNSTLTI